MLATKPKGEAGWVGRFSPERINEAWGMRKPAGPDAITGLFLLHSEPLATESAVVAHPDDLLDQVLHDQCKCGCYNH